MKDCEEHEILVSAWQDGELDRGGQVEMLDHLMECAGCRDFYRDVRGLDRLAAAVRTAAAAGRPSPEVWERIERAARSGDPSRTRDDSGGRLRRVPIAAWAAAAAAVVVLLVALGAPRGRGPASADPAAIGATIRLGEKPGGLDDAGFVRLTEQVLASDRRYREALYQVMKQVVEDTAGREASVDTLRQTDEGRGTAESAGTADGRS